MPDIRKLPQFRNLRHLYEENVEKSNKAIAAYEAYRATPTLPQQHETDTDEITWLKAKIEHLSGEVAMHKDLGVDAIKTLQTTLDYGNNLALKADTHAARSVWISIIGTCCLAGTLIVTTCNNSAVVTLTQPVQVEIVSRTSVPPDTEPQVTHPTGCQKAPNYNGGNQ